MNLRGLIFGLGFVLAVVLLFLAYQFLALQRNSAELSEAYEHSAGSIDLAIETYVVSDELTRAARTYVSTEDPKYEEQYNQIIAIREGKQERPVDYPHLYWALVNGGVENPREGSGILISLPELYERMGFTEAEMDKLDEALKSSAKLVQLEVEAFYAIKGQYQDSYGNYSVLGIPDKAKAIDLLYGEAYHKKKFEIMKSIDEFVDMMRVRVDSDIKKEIAEQAQSRLLFTIALIAALLIIFAIAFLTREQNKRELAQREQAQRRAEDENERMNDSVISILEAVNLLSQKDLTARAPVTEDIIGTVSDSINALSAETANVLLGVTDIAGEVATVSGNVKSQADQVSLTAQQERENVQRMIESLLDTTQTMNQVAALAEQSNESAGEATKVTNDALNTVNETVAGMDTIRETISETEKRIKRLGERSQEISGIVNLINTISERTHVLALNASMQAAVAGEAGRGFAVVAEEVQRLAESSRNATQQIATLVSNIQIETNETINTVNETIGQVVEGSAQAQRAGEQMRLTQQITDRLVAQVRDIATASEQQKSMSVELLESVQRIGDSTEQTAQQIEAQNKEAELLLQASVELIGSVNVFKLPTRDDATVYEDNL